MATCKWCEKTSLFLKVSKNGLCENCNSFFIMDLELRTKHINESTSIIQQSFNTDTILSRFDFIVQELKHLLQYELRGIQTINPLPSEGLKTMNSEERDRHIVYGLEKELEKLSADIKTMKTKNGRINKLDKLTKRCESFKQQMIDPFKLANVESEIEKLFGEITSQTV